MPNCLSERTQKLMTYVAGFLMLLPNGITWYWGNVSIYVHSYFHHKNKTTSHDMRAPWLLSMYVVSWSTALFVSGYIDNKIKRRPTIALGVVIFDGGLIASYFVFAYSLISLDISMGIVGGFGNGMIHAMILQTIVDWTVVHVGLATALMFTSYAIGSIIINQFITHYLNPDNKKVDVIIGKAHFFSQEDILNKVPSVFLGLFVWSVVFHVIGFLLLRTKNTPEANPDDSLRYDEESQKENEYLSHLEKLPISPKQNISGHIQGADNPCKSDYDDVSTSANKTCVLDQIKRRPLDDSMDSTTPDHGSSPSQVLRSWFFYVLWFTMFGSDTGYMTLFNYYKIFGQVWIKDDHFLTNLGTTLALATIGMRLMWGFLADRFGIKSTLVSLTGGLAFVSAGYFFVAQVNKWLFFSVTILFACLNCGIYTNFMVAVHSLYGKTHFTSNCGLLASSTIVLNLIFPSVTQLLVSHFGWFSLFFTVGAVNFLCLLLIVCCLPD